MNESKPVDLEAIRARVTKSISTSLNLGDEMDEQQEDCLALCDEVESLRERVKANGLKWTEEKPTKEGWYWHRWKNSGCEPVYITNGKYGLYIEKDGDICQMISDSWGLWCPIPKPTEGNQP